VNSKNYTPIRNPPARERGRLVHFRAAADDACTMTAALARGWEKVAVEAEVSLVRAVPRLCLWQQQYAPGTVPHRDDPHRARTGRVRHAREAGDEPSMKGMPISTTRLKSLRAGRFGRTALLLGAAGATVGGMLLGAGCSSAPGQNPAASGAGVALSAASGSTSSTPTWSTTVACPSGYQGSATFKEVHSDGVSTNLIAPIVNGTAAPFQGTLQASIAQIQAAGRIPDGGTQELFVTCFSMQSGLGNGKKEMHIYISYSADGSTYTTSATRP
jgi:hypothetical protein